MDEVDSVDLVDLVDCSGNIVSRGNPLRLLSPLSSTLSIRPAMPSALVLALSQPQYIPHLVQTRTTPNDPSGCLDRSASKGLSTRRFVGQFYAFA